MLVARLTAERLDLEIETGRYKLSGRTEYALLLYNGGIENEIHFLYYFCRLEHIRLLYIDIIFRNWYSFSLLCTEDYVLEANKLVRQL